MLKIFLLLLLISLATSNCLQGDSFECTTSLCVNFNEVNGSCIADNTTNCTAGQQVSVAGNCTSCSNLNSSTCTSTCPDWYVNTTNNSTCESCESKYGSNCIECTINVCQRCSQSSNTLLANDSLSCVNSSSNCNISNCGLCSSVNGTIRCTSCSANYNLDAVTGLCVSVSVSCASANAFECASSKCATYTWNNNTCSVDNASTCTVAQQVPSAGNCTSCDTLNVTACNTTCNDWYYNTTANTCMSCSVRYGADCIQCSETACTMCAFSSNTLLSNTSQCVSVSSACSIANCISCSILAGNERCSACGAGFMLNPSNTCSMLVANCLLANAAECDASICASYAWINNTCAISSACTPNSEVPVVNSTTCITCNSLNASACNTTCTDWYYNSTANVCTNCANKYGTNCISCSETVCTACASYSNTLLANDSLSCVNSTSNNTNNTNTTNQTNCTLANCNTCQLVGNVSTCLACSANYALNPSNTCSAIVANCSIADTVECSASVCASYAWNGTCVVSSTCINGA